MEILPAVSNKDDWSALFTTQDETKAVLKFLITAATVPQEPTTTKTLQPAASSAALKASQIQTCARLLSQSWLAASSPEFVQGTFKLVLHSTPDTNL